jgi:hypothetical protein
MNLHHNAPPLADRLELDHASLAAQANDAVALVAADVAPVTNDDEAGAYAEAAKTLKGIAAQIEKVRKAEKEETLKAGRTIDAFFAKMADPVKAAADRLVGAINTFQRAKLEAERKAAAEAAERARKEAEAFDETPPEPVATVVREAARVTSITGVKATASRKWVHEITNREEVPRQYLMVNDAAIKAAIAGGVRDIPGVRIYEDVRTAIR